MIDFDSLAARLARNRLEMLLDARSATGQFTDAEKAIVRAALHGADENDIASRRGVTVSTVRSQARRAARKAHSAGLLELVDTMLRSAALDGIGAVELVIAMLRPDGSCGFALSPPEDSEARGKASAQRLESAIATVVAVDRLVDREVCVLRLRVAGVARPQIAEILDWELFEVDKCCSAICRKRDVPRVVHLVHDVLRLACGVRLERYASGKADRAANRGRRGR